MSNCNVGWTLSCNVPIASPPTLPSLSLYLHLLVPLCNHLFINIWFRPTQACRSSQAKWANLRVQAEPSGTNIFAYLLNEPSRAVFTSLTKPSRASSLSLYIYMIRVRTAYVHVDKLGPEHYWVEIFSSKLLVQEINWLQREGEPGGSDRSDVHCMHGTLQRYLVTIISWSAG